MDYPSDKKGRLATLKGHLCGVQRVPSIFMFAPEASLSELHLNSYCVRPCEPLHDLKSYLAAVLRKLPSYLAAVLRKLPSVLPVSALKSSVSQYLDTVWKKANLYGSDYEKHLWK